MQTGHGDPAACGVRSLGAASEEVNRAAPRMRAGAAARAD
jgi:hypothetical protein